MTNYEFIQHQKNVCEIIAATTSDNALRTFYAKAARGFEIKLENLTLNEAAND